MQVHLPEAAAAIAQQLSALTGEDIEMVIIHALEDKLKQQHRAAAKPPTIICDDEGVPVNLNAKQRKIIRFAKADTLLQEIWKLPIYDHRSADEIIGYNDQGLP
jgi:hypothetical protein